MTLHEVQIFRRCYLILNVSALSLSLSLFLCAIFQDKNIKSKISDT